MRGYDLETDTADLPYRVTRGINPGKAGWDREVGDDEETEREREERERVREREKERGEERNSQRECSWSRKISTDRTHMHTYVRAHDDTSLLITDNI